jgi:glycosyltransferase involved in cell wall biosynthesis
MALESQEQVFSGLQIVPLNLHLGSKITGGDCYNTEMLKACEELGGKMRGFVFKLFPKPFRHLIWGNIFWMSKVADMANRAIFVYGTSDFWPLFFTIFYIRAFRSSKMIAITHHLSYAASSNIFKRQLRRLLEMLMCKWADFHIVNSRTTKEAVQQISGIDKQVAIVPPAINIVCRRPMSFVRRNPPYNIISVGFVAPYKGVEDSIQAVAILTDLDVKLHFVGDNSLYDPGYGEYCQNLVNRLNLQKRVIFHGFIGNDQLNEMMLRTDIYVSSSHLEGYGMSIVEAASYSLPLVISDLPAFRDIAGNDALYFPVGDYRALAEKIRLLLGNYKLRLTLSKAIRRRIDFDYGWEKMRTLVGRCLGQWWKQNHQMKESTPL